nr:immunoglobulin heavy chain junction region [Macaca mulatta]
CARDLGYGIYFLDHW